MPSASPQLPPVVRSHSELSRRLDKIKLFKNQCQDVLRRHKVVVQSPNVASDTTLSLHIRDKLSMWSKWDAVDTFFHHEAIKLDLRDMHHRLDAAMHTDINFLEADRERAHGQLDTDARELRSLVYTILTSSDDKKKLVELVREKRSRKEIEAVMRFAQLELAKGALSSDEAMAYYEGLWYLFNKTRMLPPLATLNGQLILQTHDLAVHGPAYWLNKKPVLLQPLPRVLSQNAELRHKFEREILKWRDLDYSHHNLSHVYGIVDIGCDLYLVSSWPKRRKLMDHVPSETYTDRFKHLIEVAKGLEYLHRKGIIHGSLYTNNILVAEDGKACISYYGVTSFLEQHSVGDADLTELADVRRSAPEITIMHQTLTVASDIWSFGMLALEILAAKIPFCDISPDIWVLSHLERLQLTSCTMSEQIDAAHRLPYDIKRLLDDCWSFDPLKRVSFRLGERLERIEQQSPRQGLLLEGSSAGNSMTNLEESSYSARSSEDRPPSHSPLWSTPHTTNYSSSLSSLSLPRVPPTEHIRRHRVQPPKPTMEPIHQGVPQSSPPSAEYLVKVEQPPPPPPEHEKKPLNRYQSIEDGSTPSPQEPIQNLPHNGSHVSSPRPIITQIRRPSTAGSGFTRDGLLSPNSVGPESNLGSITPSTLGLQRQVYMHALVEDAFGSHEWSAYRPALLEACDYVKGSKYELLKSPLESSHPEFDTQFRVLKTVILSLSHPPRSFVITHMPPLRRICEELANKAPDHDKRRETQQMLVYIDKRGDLQPPITPGNQVEPSKKAREMARDMANALAFIQSEKYRAINPSSDYIDYFLLEESSSTVQDALNTHTAIVLWVQNYVLSGRTLTDRFSTCKFLLDIAFECKSIADLASMFAIGEGLLGDKVAKLPLENQLLMGNSRLREMLGDLKKERYEVVAKKASNQYTPWLRYHIEKVELATSFGRLANHPSLPKLEEVNVLMDEVQKHLYRLPQAKTHEKGEKLFAFMNSRIHDALVAEGGVEGYTKKLQRRLEELCREEELPQVKQDALRLLGGR